MNKRRIALVIVMTSMLVAMLVPATANAITVDKRSVTDIHSGNTFYAHAPANKKMNFCLHLDDNDSEVVWKVHVYNYPTNYDKTYTIKWTNAANNRNASITLPKNSKNRIYGVKVTVVKATLDKSWYTFRAYAPNVGYYSRTCN